MFSPFWDDHNPWRPPRTLRGRIAVVAVMTLLLATLPTLLSWLSAGTFSWSTVLIGGSVGLFSGLLQLVFPLRGYRETSPTTRPIGRLGPGYEQLDSRERRDRWLRSL